MTSRFLGAALVLGLLSAIGPFAIDMYLPALPSIQQHLHADVRLVQMSLMAFFIALGVGQLVYGPLSDMLGRKPPLYFGLVLFGIASIGCALAPDIHVLILCRFVQGLGACAGTVIPRAIVRDLHTGPEAAQLMALLMLVFSVSPVLAPLTGSLVIQLANWRVIFYVIAGAAVAGLVLVGTLLKETRLPEQRLHSGLNSALRGYVSLLRDGHVMGLIFIGAFGTSSFFIYLANSSFVLIQHFGLSSTQYSLAFAVNAVAFIGAAQFAGRLSGRWGLRRVVRLGTLGYAISMSLLALVFLAGLDRLAPLITVLFIGYGCLGLVSPSVAVLTLEQHGRIAGTASALMGTLQFVVGAVLISVVGLFVDGTARPMLCGIAACSLLALVLTRTILREPLIVAN